MTQLSTWGVLATGLLWGFVGGIYWMDRKVVNGPRDFRDGIVVREDVVRQRIAEAVSAETERCALVALRIAKQWDESTPIDLPDGYCSAGDAAREIAARLGE